MAIKNKIVKVFLTTTLLLVFDLPLIKFNIWYKVQSHWYWCDSWSCSKLICKRKFPVPILVFLSSSQAIDLKLVYFRYKEINEKRWNKIEMIEWKLNNSKVTLSWKKKEKIIFFLHKISYITKSISNAYAVA